VTSNDDPTVFAPPATPSAAAPAAAAPAAAAPAASTPRLGLGVNAAQFSLLVAVNALVGGMLGQERTVLPLLASRVFAVSAYSSALVYIAAFGAVKAATNYLAGTLSDRYGRKPVLVAGWLVGLPVPLLLIWAPSWGWVIAANALLGVNQGLTWSTTVIMKIDLVGPARRGLAMGLNEAAGYGAVAVTALATGYLATTYGLRPVPFYLGIAYAALGLGASILFVRETHHHARLEAHSVATHTTIRTATRAAGTVDTGKGQHDGLSDRQIFLRTSFTDRALSSASQAGLVNNLNDGLAWGLFPVLFAAAGLSVARIGILAALYPAVWGAGQLATGALSDRIGRKPLIVAGMLVQAAALAGFAAADTFPGWAFCGVALGAGTAMVYPTLLAVVGDVAHPSWRARSVGVYRLWRDGGFAVGAVASGLVADAWGIRAAVWTVAVLTAASGLLAAARMTETLHRAPSTDPPAGSGR
jgi:MFS family permease